jgi:hypothetical protein
VVPYADIIDEREKAALGDHADKLDIESPEIFARTVFRNGKSR